MTAIPSQRRVRQAVQKHGQVIEQAIPMINALMKVVPEMQPRLEAVEAFTRKSFWQRLRWVLVGR